MLLWLFFPAPFYETPSSKKNCDNLVSSAVPFVFCSAGTMLCWLVVWSNCRFVFCVTGLVYLGMKHLVDRYNIFFAYNPSKINKHIHGSAVNFVLWAVIMLQINITFFTGLRAGTYSIFVVGVFCMYSFWGGGVFFVPSMCRCYCEDIYILLSSLAPGQVPIQLFLLVFIVSSVCRYCCESDVSKCEVRVTWDFCLYLPCKRWTALLQRVLTLCSCSPASSSSWPSSCSSGASALAGSGLSGPISTG